MKRMFIVVWIFLLATAVSSCAPQLQLTPRAQIWFEGAEAFKKANYEEAYSKIRDLADEGDPYAASRVGEMYATGKGAPQDLNQAMEWLRKADELGDPLATYLLGFIDEASSRGEVLNETENFEFFKTDAESGVPEAQYSLAISYFRGEPIARDFAAAVLWAEKSAQAGFAQSQFILGVWYLRGEGVPQDNVIAYAWLNLAAAGLLPSALKDVAVAFRDFSSSHITSAELAEAQSLSTRLEQAQEAEVQEAEVQEAEPHYSAPRAPEPQVSMGSAFVVSAKGYLLTNHHVIEGCTDVRVIFGGSSTYGTVFAQDKVNDLALIRALPSVQTVAVFRSGLWIRPGDSVITVGFPLQGLLTEGLNVTTGIVSALAGPGNDARMIQITAPIQPGNSGWPLLDSSGNLVGIVVAKLDALMVAAVTGDIPQNVNFAINSRVAQIFLEANGVKYKSAPSEIGREPADIAEEAKEYTAAIECQS